MTKLYVLVHNFVSHDMFVPQSAKVGEPRVMGVFSTRAKAQKHIRPEADDFIVPLWLDQISKEEV